MTPNGFVLIVEDDPVISETLAELLEIEGYRSQRAANGRQALDWLATHSERPHVILLDLMMPVCSGYEFLEIIKKQDSLKKIPVLVMSAAADAKSTAQRHSAEYVRKPLDADELLGTLQRYFARESA